MESTIVNACVPRAKMERVSSILASLGATTSDPLNDAIDYEITKGKLPNSSEANLKALGDFEMFLVKSTLEIDWPDDFGGNYKKLAKGSRLADHESLA